MSCWHDLPSLLHSFVDHDMMMRHFGHGVGHGLGEIGPEMDVESDNHGTEDSEQTELEGLEWAQEEDIRVDSDVDLDVEEEPESKGEDEPGHLDDDDSDDVDVGDDTSSSDGDSDSDDGGYASF